jgi:HEAT repeat protein
MHPIKESPTLMPVLLGLLFIALPQLSWADDLSSDMELLKSAGFNPANGQSLLPLFKGRSSANPPKESIDKLIILLLKGSTEEKITAKRDLVCLGEYAVSTLKKTTSEIIDPTPLKSLKECLELTEGKGSENLIISALKVLSAEGKPETADILFDYIPFAPEESVRIESEAALKTLFLAAPENSIVFEKRLADPNPYKRAVAGEILVRHGKYNQAILSKKLLEDPTSLVKARLVVAYLDQKNSIAIPAALKLLGSDAKEIASLIDSTLTNLAGEWAFNGPKNNDQLSRAVKQSAWSGWWNALNEQDLLELFKSSAATADETNQTNKIFRTMDFEVIKRHIEGKDFKSNQALNYFFLNRISFDPKMAKLFESNLLSLKQRSSVNQSTSSLLRLISLVKPKNAMGVLLAYSPFCPDDSTFELVGECMADLIVEQSNSQKTLMNGADSIIDETRALAGKTLVKVSTNEAQQKCELLLSDPSSRVRFETAKAMVKNQNKKGIPVLIDLISVLPPEKNDMIDQLLRAIAKEKSPESKNDIKADSEAWKSWWQKEGTNLVLSPSLNSPEMMRNFLVVESFNQEKKSGRVFLVSPSGRILWEIASLSNPTDALLLPNNKILVTEQGANRVTERDTKGNISWEKSAPNPFCCQRLANGNFLIASRNKISEVEKNGNEIFNFQIPNETILAAAKTRGNDFALLTYNGTFLRVDSKGSEISRTRIPFPTNFGINGGAITQNDRVLVSIPTVNKIMEFDFNGQPTWEATVTTPGIPAKLPNGNVVAPSLNGSKFVEIRMDGKIIFESAQNPFRTIKVGKAP